MMKAIRLVALFVLSLCVFQGMTQINTDAAIIPKINIGIKLPNQFSLNVQAETRNHFFESNPQEWLLLAFDRAEFAGFLSYKFDVGAKLTLGYHLQLKDQEWAQRTIQQVSLVQRLETSRLGHRFALEENFGNNRIQSGRFRYRIVWERSLAGERIDPKEWYLKIGNEYLLAFNSSIESLEIRLLPVFGFEVSMKNKMELGPDLRYTGIFASSQKLQLFANIAWYYLL